MSQDLMFISTYVENKGRSEYKLEPWWIFNTFRISSNNTHVAEGRNEKGVHKNSASARDVRRDLNNQQHTHTSKSHTKHVNDPNHFGKSRVGSICTWEPMLGSHVPTPFICNRCGKRLIHVLILFVSIVHVILEALLLKHCTCYAIHCFNLLCFCWFFRSIANEVCISQNKWN